MACAGAGTIGADDCAGWAMWPCSSTGTEPPYLEHARRAGRPQPRRPGRTAVSRPPTGDIRAWAKDRGIAVNERGRIPASVAEQYRAAHNGR